MIGSIPAFEKDSIFLGTAGWGAKVSKAAALELVSTFYQTGFRWVDTSTNYPINHNPSDYGQTIGWLSEFRSDFPELKIFVKAGSRTNSGESENFINASYFDLLFEMLVGRLGGTLAGLGVHWDNGSDNDDRKIVIEFFAGLHKRGYRVGLSGIAHKEIYSNDQLGRSLPWSFQLNLSPTRGDRIVTDIAEIRDHFPFAQICGFNTLGGISAKGLPNGSNRLAALAASVNEFAGMDGEEILNRVLRRAGNNGVDALIIGPTNIAQFVQWNTAIQDSSRG